MSKTIAAGNELLNFVHEALKRGYGLAAAAASPTYSPVGQYFFGEEPNLMVLSATTESGYESDLDKGHPRMTAIASTSTVTEISVGSIPDQNFRIPTDWKLKKDKEFDSLR
jgi:hypothetical protein